MLEEGDQLEVAEFRMRIRYEERSAPRGERAESGLRPKESGAGDVRAIVPWTPFAPPANENGPGPLVSVTPVWVDQIQRQMLDQFQQSLMTVFQMLGTLQREQAEMVRHELDQIRQIAQEMERA